MKFLNKKMIAAVAGLAGLSGMLLMPMSAQADGYRHHYHHAGHWVRYRNCHRISYHRYCRMRHGYQQCYVVRHSRFNCVY